MVFYDPAAVTPGEDDPSRAKQYPIAAMEAAYQAGNAKAANMVMLGALAACSELISEEALKQVLSEGPTKHAQQSMGALDKGFKLARQQIRV